MVYEFFGRGRLSRGKEKSIFDLSSKDKRKLSKMGDSYHNMLDRNRDKQRLSQSRGGIAPSNSHQPVGHHRLRGHTDPKVALKPRGGDSRTVVPNKNNVVRRIRDNDAINIDRPLG